MIRLSGSGESYAFAAAQPCMRCGIQLMAINWPVSHLHERTVPTLSHHGVIMRRRNVKSAPRHRRACMYAANTSLCDAPPSQGNLLQGHPSNVAGLFEVADLWSPSPCVKGLACDHAFAGRLRVSFCNAYVASPTHNDRHHIV